MQPPCGGALLSLRSVAPRDRYKDRVTGKMIEPVTTGQIYWGSVPFIVIQLLMVAAVMAFPGMVMHYKSDAATVDPSSVSLEVGGGAGAGAYGADSNPFI
ncbi:hypothetical protein G6F59_018859 [Rhizopus arrhizus]|nr:hypothetical protein G6F59_018859 [Rhizopus arrhizus]